VLLDFIDSLLDELAGTLDHFDRLNCIAETEVARLAESTAGNCENATLGESVDHDLFLNAVRDLGECVEGTLRILDLKTSLTKTVAEGLTTGIVPINVHLSIASLSTSKLDDCRCIDETKDTSPESAGGHDELATTVLGTSTRIDGDVTKTLTGDAEILAEGSDDNVVLVGSSKDVAVLGSRVTVDDLGIRLIRDDPESLLVLLGGGLCDLGDGVNHLLAVNLAAGVVGAVDDDAAGLLADGSLQSLNVRLEIAVRAGKNAESGTNVLCIEAVLAEIRSEGNDLFAGRNNRAEEHVDGTSSTNTDAEAFRRNLDVTVHLRHTLCISLNASRITAVGSVGMEASLLRLAQTLKSILELLGRLQGRIAQTEIKHVLTTVLCGKFGTKLKHCTNRTATSAHVLAMLANVLHFL